MHTFKPSLLGLGLVVSALVAGCSAEGTDQDVSSADAKTASDSAASMDVTTKSAKLGGASSQDLNLDLGLGVKISGGTVHHSTANIKVDVSASTTLGGALTYYWSGYSLNGSVKGGAEFVLDASVASGCKDEPVVHVVVVASNGALAWADFDLRVKVGADVGLFCNGGDTDGGWGNGSGSGSCDAGGSCSCGSGGSIDASVQACLSAHVQCDLGCVAKLNANQCDQTAELACEADCCASLSVCLSVGVKANP